MDAGPDQAEQFDAGNATVTLLPGASPPHNLPQPLTSFIGRERELAELRQQLESARLLTLTGAGGCGKTRLAIQTASEILERFPDGAWWVELAPLGDGELVGAAIAEALGVRPLPGMTSLQAAAAFLASSRALLIFDNCEHLLRACGEASEALLQAAPDLVMLATSRATLGVDGETEWRVPSLSMPGSPTPTRALNGSDAVRLFLARASDARPDFAVTEENAESVAVICERVDGLPLAIELAAARLRMLSVGQIAERVTDRFRLLTRAPATATPRQQTLRASVDWSYGLLSSEEKILMRRLGVFAGSFDLDAVERACSGDGIEPDQALDLLTSVAEQSLVIAEEMGATMRYRLLETVRQYAVEMLAVANEEEEIRARHRDHFLALAEQAAPHLETVRKRQWLEVLDPEAANLAAAIDHALHTEPALALRFCAALWRWWRARGRIAEAELAHSRSLAASGDREPGLRARVQLGSAFIDIVGAQFEEAEVHATEALALAEEVGDQSTAARARCEIADAIQFGNPAAARSELAHAAELARASDDDWALVQAIQIVALTHMTQSDHEQCARANDEVTELAERLGEPYQVARRWYFVGWMAITDGRLAEAREACARMYKSVEGVGEPIMETIAEVGLGLVRIWEGEAECALDRLEKVLERAIRLGLGMLVPMLLASIAHAELATGRFEKARERLEGLVALVQGRVSFVISLALGLLAETQRLLGDSAAAQPTALEAQETGEQSGNRLWATRARLTLGRLAAARDEWSAAQQHVLAHLDTCVEGGHATYVPACLDALAEVAAGVQADEDAVRLLVAAERARAEIGIVRIPPEEQHWAAIELKLHDALGDEAYEAAWAQGAQLSIEDALEWARRARGPRQRPAGGWESLTPTERKVVELVAEGLTNPQIGERMFISPATVKTHLAHIFGKLDVHSRAELTAYAVRHEKSS